MNNIKKFGAISLFAAFGALLFLGVVHAAIEAPELAKDFDELIQRICSLVNVLFTALIVVAIGFIIYAAFLYVTSAGDSERVRMANHQITFAVIALVVGLFAKSVPLVVNGALGNTKSINPCKSGGSSFVLPVGRQSV